MCLLLLAGLYSLISNIRKENGLQYITGKVSALVNNCPQNHYLHIEKYGHDFRIPCLRSKDHLDAVMPGDSIRVYYEQDVAWIADPQHAAYKMIEGPNELVIVRVKRKNETVYDNTPQRITIAATFSAVTLLLCVALVVMKQKKIIY